jgi:hypothetical protein
MLVVVTRIDDPGLAPVGRAPRPPRPRPPAPGTSQTARENPCQVGSPAGAAAGSNWNRPRLLAGVGLELQRVVAVPRDAQAARQVHDAAGAVGAAGFARRGVARGVPLAAIFFPASFTGRYSVSPFGGTTTRQRQSSAMIDTHWPVRSTGADARAVTRAGCCAEQRRSA